MKGDSPRRFIRHLFPGDVSNRSRISFEMIGSRRPKIHPVIDGQKVISHRVRQRVILHGEGGEVGVSVIVRGRGGGSDRCV